MSVLNFLFKSKEQAERDKRELEAASYPYGAAQREKLEALLEALLPEEPEQLRRTIFLLVKRAYAKDLSNPLEDSAPLRENLPDTFTLSVSSTKATSSTPFKPVSLCAKT